MSERYRKWGRTIRFERGTIVEAVEAGEAIESGERFQARPFDVSTGLTPSSDALKTVTTFVDAIRSVVPVNIERLIVTAGVTEHDFEGIRWRETHQHVHITMNNGRLRTKLDLGEFALDEIQIVANALANVRGRHDTPQRCVVAPHVSAVLLPGMGLKLIQTARGRDGKGSEIEELVLERASFPNWYRPSYRVRPVRGPFHIRTAEFGTIPQGLPRIVALLRIGETSDVLCDDGESVFETTIRINQVKAAGPPVAWYPHLAGAFGHEVML